LELVNHPRFEFIRGDIRDKKAVETAVANCYGVAHLAAIVGDPASRKEPELTHATNLDGSCLLWDTASRSGCQRFVFASTCSNYGKMPDSDAYVTEGSPLQPLSLYAETKVEFEKFLLGRSRQNGCKPVCLRFSTVYGLSPRVRFDLTVNEFTRDLTLGKELVIFGEQFWRPYCHVQDLGRSVMAVLAAGESKVAFETFNVGDTTENYTKAMVVAEIQRQIPNAKVKYVPKQEDARDYRVDFSKIRDQLGFAITRRVSDGIREIRLVLQQGLLQNPYDARYSNT
jgi:nucleoside-diphosphate-sugar epimerase